MSSSTPARRGTRVATRADLAAFADDLVLSTRPFASPSGSLLTLPGTPGGYGTAVDGLEGFARTFLAVGFRIAGEHGADPHGHLERYAAGLAAGTDPHHAERWIRPSEAGQAKVEAASLALVLDLTRPWLWDRLEATVQEQIVDYLAEVVGDETYPPNNWLWFRITVETFLRSVDGPHRLEDIAADLERHDSYFERDGWYRDGNERAYDHYVGWAMHLYPTLWSRMAGAADLAAARAETDRSRLDRFLQDAVHLVGGDGSPLVQGRSLVYRFAAAAPYWVGAIAEVPSVPLGQLREAGLAVVDHFAARGIPNERGLLDLGWGRPWRQLAQNYSGTGSPYWATKGLLGLVLPAEHPVWSAPAVALPADDGDRALAIAAPTWAVASTAADGVVRVSNHGADHAHPGDDGGDSPIYTRLGYSTATFPLHRGVDWSAPLDQSVVLVDADGRRSHRSGMTALGAHVDGPAAVAASRADAHWLTPEGPTVRHGSGLTGTATAAGTLTTVSVLRGAWEVRLVHLADASAAAVTLECGGWALAHDAGVVVALAADGQRIDLTSPTQTAALVGLAGWDGVDVVHRNDASPLGAHAAVGVLAGGLAPGWRACAVGLAGLVGTENPLDAAPSVSLTGSGTNPDGTTTDSRALVVWADGETTDVVLPHPGAATAPGSTA